MELVAHFHLELQVLDAKKTFHNKSFFEDVYMVQLDSFVKSGKENMCNLKKSTYGLKQASR